MRDQDQASNVSFRYEDDNKMLVFTKFGKDYKIDAETVQKMAMLRGWPKSVRDEVEFLADMKFNPD